MNKKLILLITILIVFFSNKLLFSVPQTKEMAFKLQFALPDKITSLKYTKEYLQELKTKIDSILKEIETRIPKIKVFDFKTKKYFIPSIKKRIILTQKNLDTKINELDKELTKTTRALEIAEGKRKVLIKRKKPITKEELRKYIKTITPKEISQEQLEKEIAYPKKEKSVVLFRKKLPPPLPKKMSTEDRETQEQIKKLTSFFQNKNFKIEKIEELKSMDLEELKLQLKKDTKNSNQLKKAKTNKNNIKNRYLNLKIKYFEEFTVPIIIKLIKIKIEQKKILERKKLPTEN